jgi:hypothetical protein
MGVQRKGVTATFGAGNIRTGFGSDSDRMRNGTIDANVIYFSVPKRRPHYEFVHTINKI